MVNERTISIKMLNISGVINLDAFYVELSDLEFFLPLITIRLLEISAKLWKNKRTQKITIVVFQINKPCIPPASREASNLCHDRETYGNTNQKTVKIVGIRNNNVPNRLTKALDLSDSDL